MSDIEFPFLIEKGPINVELNYKGFLRTVFVFCLSLHYTVQFIDFIDNCDSMASVCQFSGFDDPDVSHFPFDHLSIFHLLFLKLHVSLTLFIIR